MGCETISILFDYRLSLGLEGGMVDYCLSLLPNRCDDDKMLPSLTGVFASSRLVPFVSLPLRVSGQDRHRPKEVMSESIKSKTTDRLSRSHAAEVKAAATTSIGAAHAEPLFDG